MKATLFLHLFIHTVTSCIPSRVVAIELVSGLYERDLAFTSFEYDVCVIHAATSPCYLRLAKDKTQKSYE